MERPPDNPKQPIRERVWQAMQEGKVARFPGAKGRIPNFIGSEKAAGRAVLLDEWKKAKVLKCNPDSPQQPLRKRALQEGKRIYMAVPRLVDKKPFIEIDPAAVDGRFHYAATIKGAFHLGKPVSLEEMSKIDLIVCGSVAVNRKGARIGKGGGYSDLEFALATEAGLITKKTIIITTVHALQVVDDDLLMTEHDIPLDYIITPDETIACKHKYTRPNGIYWEMLPEEKRAEIPVLSRSS